MSDLTLGRKIPSSTVLLTRDSDYDCTLHNNSGDWSATLVATLVFGTTTWTATTVGPDITFHEPAATVNTLIATAPTVAHLFYADGGANLLWMYGGVIVNG